jgi:hypothetical protein
MTVFPEQACLEKMSGCRLDWGLLRKQKAASIQEDEKRPVLLVSMFPQSIWDEHWIIEDGAPPWTDAHRFRC